MRLGRYWKKFCNLIGELRLNIRTSGNTESDLPDSEGYSALGYREIDLLFTRVELSAEDVFVDIGCGRGRVVCSVARLPVKRVIGIEVDPGFAADAKRNGARLRGRRAAIEIRKCHAADAEYGEGTVFYLYNPFGRRTLEEVLDKIDRDQQVKERTGGLRLIYVHPLHEAALRERGWKLTGTISADPSSWSRRHRVSFWRKAPEAASAAGPTCRMKSLLPRFESPG